MVKAISVLAVVLLMLFGGTVHANPRQTLTDSGELSITTMRPLNPQPGKTLRMSGRLRNTSSDTIASIQVRLLLSTTPMATRSEIATVTAGAADRDGPPTLAVSEPIALLLPRTNADWSLELPLDDLPLIFPWGPRGRLGGDRHRHRRVTQRLGLTRTFLPWFPQGSVTPVSLAWLWPVTSRPDRGLAGLQLSEQTAAEMAAGGRLDRIINNAGDSRITWVFDPCVLQTAEDMVDGYSVAGPASSQSTAGAGAPAAEQWLAAARSASKQRSVATPYAFPDATAPQRAGMDKTVTQSTATAAAEVAASTRASVSGVLAWPAAGITTPRPSAPSARPGRPACCCPMPPCRPA